MTDFIDQANEQAEMFLRLALECQRGHAARLLNPKSHSQGVAEPARTECEEPHCGEPIPDARRLLLPGVRLCVECQARLEKGYGR